MPELNVSRRKVLAGLGTIGVASAGAGLGTTAFFSDEESLDGSIQAGRVDLLLDYRTTYSPGLGYAAVSGDRFDDLFDPSWTAPEDVYIVDGTDESTFQVDAVPGNESRWAINDTTALSHEDWGTMALELDACTNSTVARELVDGDSKVFVDLTDIKPYDRGETTFSLHLCDNPAYLSLTALDVVESENGRHEPEETAGDASSDTGELADYLHVDLWYDPDCSNTRGDGETLLYTGSLAGLLDALAEGMPLSPHGVACADPVRECFDPGVHCFALEWTLPCKDYEFNRASTARLSDGSAALTLSAELADKGLPLNANVVQTDSVSFDLQFAAEQCRHNGTAVTHHVPDEYETIQAAVDAASAGDTVAVAAGTYVEQVEIPTPLTLVGAGVGQTTIEAPETLVSRYTVSANGNTYDHYPVVYVAAEDVHVRNLTVDGALRGDAHYRFDGLTYRNASGTVADVEITRVSNDPLNGTQHGIGLTVRNADGTPRSVAAARLDVHDIQKNGVTATGDGLSFCLFDSTVTGMGPSNTIGQNGVQVSGVADALIVGNDVSGHDWIPNTFLATGILTYQAGRVAVVGNYLHDNEVGHADFGSTAVVDSRNDFVNNRSAGALDYDSTAIDARFNWWGSADGPSSAYGTSQTDPVTGVAADGSGDGVYAVRFDPWAMEPFTQ